MDADLLKRYLDEGLSLEQIGVLVGRHPSTVAYWLKKHGLKANGSERFSPRGNNITKPDLERLVAEGASLRELAEHFECSVGTVRYWMSKHAVAATGTTRRRKLFRDAESIGATRVSAPCRWHGVAEYVRSAGGWKCRQCNAENVSEWRRRVKRILVDEAGGCCRLCGYDRYQGALQFHHVNPDEKSFIISRHGVTRSLPEARREAAKCILLCANCHAEVESGLDQFLIQEDLRSIPVTGEWQACD